METSLSAKHQQSWTYHRFLWVYHGVQQRVKALVLVQGRGSDGLLTHGALVSITRALVVVRIGH